VGYDNLGIETVRLRRLASLILATLQLLRPLNLVLSLVGVAVGAVLAAGWEAAMTEHASFVVIAMLSAAAIGSAANAVNDAFDVEIDRVNRPDRPIPSGRVSGATARLTWYFGASLGIGLSLFLTPLHVGIAVFSVIAVFFYSSRLKRYGFLGNVVVSLVVSTSLIYGGLATGPAGIAWVGFIAAFVLTLAREITKDLEDMEGDRAGNVRSLPIAFGERQARWVVVVLISIAVVAAPVPFTHLDFSGLYLLVVGFTCLILLAVAWLLGAASNQLTSYSRASLLLKTAMVTGMIGLILS
jgi:geranylgeranylglycerol-phosphate geranylgeranyltransferase